MYTEGEVSVVPWKTAKLAPAVGAGLECVPFGADVVAFPSVTVLGAGK